MQSDPEVRSVWCPVVLATTLALTVAAAAGLLLRGADSNLQFALPIAAAGAVLAVVLLEKRRRECLWLADAPSKRAVLYLLLLVAGFLAFLCGYFVLSGITPAVGAGWLLLFVMPVIATLVLHQRYEHSGRSDTYVSHALRQIARLPLYLLLALVAAAIIDLVVKALMAAGG